MAEPKKYRKFTNEELSDPEEQTRKQPPVPRIPPPPPPRRSSYSSSPSYQPIDERVSKQTTGKKTSSQEEQSGARPKDKSARRSFSFVDHVQKNRVDDSTSAPKKSSSPSMSPVYRNVPERAKVSFNPAGRSSPSSRSPSLDSSVEDVPKKGFMKNWFSKAKDFMTKKSYAPLDQDRDDEFRAEPPSRKKDKSKKYVQLDEEAASPEKTVRSRSFLKLLQKGSFSKIPEGVSDHESENNQTGEVSRSSSEDIMDLRYAMPLTQHETIAEAASDHESDFASSGEFEMAAESEASLPVQVTRSSTETSETTTFVMRPELCRIRVNAPADIRVAYSCTGAITTCVSYVPPPPPPSPASSENFLNSPGEESEPDEQ